MKKFQILWAALVILTCQVGLTTHVQADVVGRLSQVEGRVDILKKGQLPATPAKVDDGVQPGDVLRTKSLSKAQITFMDNSTLTISPDSRVAIEEYMFDPAKQKRSAVLQLFQGLAYVVVNKVYKVKDPDFVVKTHTAVMGIRGTEFGIRLYPSSSTILNFKGVLQVGNVFPEVGQLPRRAFKVAYSFGSEGGGGHHWVFLKEMQGTSVGWGLPPTRPFTITGEDWKAFMQQLASGLTSSRGGGEGGTPSNPITGHMGATAGEQGGEQGSNRFGSVFADSVQSFLNTTLVYTPPTILPTEETPSPNPNNPNPPTPPTYNFSLTTSLLGGFLQDPSSGGTSPVLVNALSPLAILQGDWGSALPTLYTIADSSTFAPTSGTFPSRRVLGLYTATILGVVSGDLGGTLTGNATLESRYLSFRYQLSNNATIWVTIDPSGQITYGYTNGSFGGTISGTSSGEGTASPWFGSAATASTTEGSETMAAMAASSGPTALTDNSQPEATDAPALGDEARRLPAATLSTPEVGETAGAHRRNSISPDDTLKTARLVNGHRGRFSAHVFRSPVSTTRPYGAGTTANTIAAPLGPIPANFNLTGTINDPHVQFPARTMKRLAAPALAGRVAGRPQGPKARRRDINPKGNYSGTVTVNHGGRVNPVLNGTNPAIQHGAPAPQAGRVTGAPAGPPAGGPAS